MSDFLNKSRGAMQMKGTDICMDMHCKCGVMSHIGCIRIPGYEHGDFAYFVKCPSCGAIYKVDPHVNLIEVTENEPY
jgi:hypothetical protein